VIGGIRGSPLSFSAEEKEHKMSVNQPGIGAAVKIREAVVADAAGIARVHVDSWRSTYAGLLPAGFLAGLSYTGREEVWRRTLANPLAQTCVYVAESAGGQIAGFANGGAERTGQTGYDGELYAIYLLANFQRRGLGSRLVRAVAARLAAFGCASLLVWVLATNPARTFYERIGGRYVSEQEIEIGGERVREVAYGWPDLGGLLERLAAR
jgi:GNAT superfamily N-acetyltransferase